MICQFISNKEDNYYKTGKFQQTLLSIQKNPKLCHIKEKKKNNEEKLLLIFSEVKSITQAINYLEIF
jgi:transcription-repair coupling factor (superfamily II helicase)